MVATMCLSQDRADQDCNDGFNAGQREHQSLPTTDGTPRLQSPPTDKFHLRDFYIGALAQTSFQKLSSRCHPSKSVEGWVAVRDCNSSLCCAEKYESVRQNTFEKAQGSANIFDLKTQCHAAT